MFEFALFATAMVGAFLMARSVINHVSQPKPTLQPIKVETERKVRRPVDRSRL